MSRAYSRRLEASLPAVRLRAVISLDLDALDYREAAAHQERLEACLAEVRAQYPAATLEVRDRRAPRQIRDKGPRPFYEQSGRLSRYE
jgi:hypothetical protein